MPYLFGRVEIVVLDDMHPILRVVVNHIDEPVAPQHLSGDVRRALLGALAR